jgi:hypothetical protein
MLYALMSVVGGKRWQLLMQDAAGEWEACGFVTPFGASFVAWLGWPWSERKLWEFVSYDPTSNR